MVRLILYIVVKFDFLGASPAKAKYEKRSLFRKITHPLLVIRMFILKITLREVIILENNPPRGDYFPVYL